MKANKPKRQLGEIEQPYSSWAAEDIAGNF